MRYLLFLVPLLVLGQTPAEKKTPKLAPYYPTPELIVEKMLQLGNVKKGEKVFDLGSGDGRIVIIAAENSVPMPSVSSSIRTFISKAPIASNASASPTAPKSSTAICSNRTILPPMSSPSISFPFRTKKSVLFLKSS